MPIETILAIAQVQESLAARETRLVEAESKYDGVVAAFTARVEALQAREIRVAEREAIADEWSSRLLSHADKLGAGPASARVMHEILV